MLTDIRENRWKMGSIPFGPIISFRIDASAVSQLNTATQAAFNQVKAQSKQAADQLVSDWQRMSAQLRVSLSQGSVSSKETLDVHNQIISSIDRQISVLQKRNELTRAELATLKAATAERERQTDAIKRGQNVGVTLGTQSALGQVSVQTTLGIERVLDSIVDRYFGGAAGAALRTLRDVQYYSAQAAGTRGIGGGEAGAAGTAAQASRGLFGLSTGALVGGAAAVGSVAAGAAVVKDVWHLHTEGGKLAVEIDNLSRRTGLSTENLIKLRSASETLDVNFESVVTGFRKFDQEINLALSANLPNATKQAKEAGEIFKILGVDVKKAATDPYSAIEQLSKSLGTLPDGATKSAVAVLLFGRGGLELIPTLDKLKDATALTAKSSQDLATALGTDVAHSADALKAQLVNFSHRQSEALSKWS